MPELAEVERSRRLWVVGRGAKILEVILRNRTSRIFRSINPEELVRTMTGELRVEKPKYSFLKYDHLILRQSKRSLVFSDPRQFGRVQFARNEVAPSWWAKLPPSILSNQFKPSSIAEFCRRRKASPMKALLLMQERFPGIGNWMADEILWRARLNPKTRAGDLNLSETKTLFR